MRPPTPHLCGVALQASGLGVRLSWNPALLALPQLLSHLRKEGSCGEGRLASVPGGAYYLWLWKA